VVEPPLHAGPEGPHAHPRKTGLPRLDLVLAISAVFISGVSLYVAIEHGKTERDLVAANSWPFLQASIDAGGGASHDNIQLGLFNAGVGPAKLKWLEVFFDGAPVSSARDLLRRCCGLPDTGRDNQTLGLTLDYQVERVIARDEEVHLVTLAHDKADTAVFGRLSQNLLRLKFQACYCSVFDQCWTSNLIGADATEVKVCPKPATPFAPGGA
jgi:hypothetical protein